MEPLTFNKKVKKLKKKGLISPFRGPPNNEFVQYKTQIPKMEENYHSTLEPFLTVKICHVKYS